MPQVCLWQSTCCGLQNESFRLPYGSMLSRRHACQVWAGEARTCAGLQSWGSILAEHMRMHAQSLCEVSGHMLASSDA